METLDQREFSVGDWHVSPLEGVVSRNSENVRLEPKAMEVLVYLASRPGEVVSREDLENKVWRGAVVGYDAVTSTVIKVRKALGDSARESRLIATVPKRGYQLIAPVTYPEAGAPDPAEPPGAAGAAPNRTQSTPFVRLRLVLVMVMLGLTVGLAYLFMPGPPPSGDETTDVPVQAGRDALPSLSLIHI